MTCYNFCRKHALFLENNTSFLKYINMHPLHSKRKWANMIYGIAWEALREQCPYLEFFWSVFSHIKAK